MKDLFTVLIRALFTSLMVILLAFSAAMAQDASNTFNLIRASEQIPQLDELVDINVNDAELKEVLYSIGSSNKINISCDQEISGKITLTFNKIPLSELLEFIIERHRLNARLHGNVIHFENRKTEPKPPQRIQITRKDSLYDIILRNDTLGKALSELSRQSGENFILEPGLFNQQVSATGTAVTLTQALQLLSGSASLKMYALDDKLYRFERIEPVAIPAEKKTVPSKGRISISKAVNGFNIMADAADLSTLLSEAGQHFGVDILISESLKETVNVNLHAGSFNEFLDLILLNTTYAYTEKDQRYLISQRMSEANREVQIRKLYQRSLTGVMEMIPAELKKDMDIKPMPDLNALMLTGTRSSISNLEKFLVLLDVKVPVIDIEVYIVDVRDNKLVSTGLEAGLKTGGISETQGKLFPSANIEVSSGMVNEIMKGISRTGLFNLGRVGTAFYLRLKLLEDQGLLKIRSTPRLATINGHEAKLTIGRTEYYLELQNSIIGTQNPQNLLSQQYKSVNADLSLTVLPSVSEDEEITMDIHVNQTNFTERISPAAPPGTISRDFRSMVRVRNGDMLILGGLEENSRNETASGLPLLSRIPVIKWLVSSRERSKSKNQLTIFIKPTVIW